VKRQRLSEAVNCLRRAFDYYAEAGEVGRAVAVAQYPLPPAIGLLAGSAQLALQALGLVLATPETTGWMIRLLREGVAVAQGMEMDLSPELPDKLIELADNRIPPTHRTSMFEDL